MLKCTQEIINNALVRKLKGESDILGKPRSLNWLVYDQWGTELGFSSTDSLTLEVKSELETLDLFDWSK